MNPRPGTAGTALVALLALPLVASGILGCAGEDKQLDGMRAELDAIETSRDEADRKAALGPEDEDTVAPAAKAKGVGSAQPSAMASAPPPPAAPIGAPPRDVTLGAFDEAPEEYADTEDSSPRPSIRVVGSPRAGRNGWRSDDQVQQSAA